MLIALEPSDPRPLYLQIADEVRRAVVVGALAADEPLPSVRQLSGELRINPNTVQQAYRELEREGVVYVRRGLGTFVAAPDPARADRERLARGLAARAAREAYRHGLSVAELIAALGALGEALPADGLPAGDDDAAGRLEAGREESE